ncbi:replicative DNA helicase [Verrucomicrobiales bacterium]|nr:replicative DNA helicase [Verrucomicrobiales bacterium]
MPDSEFALQDPPPKGKKGGWDKDKKDKKPSLPLDFGGRSLPSSIDAEKGVLGSMLQAPEEAIGEAVIKLSADAFYVPAHRTIFEILTDLHDKGQPVDPISLQQTLVDRKLLDQVGGPSMVAELFTFVPTAANLGFYTDIVSDKSTLRRVILSCTECITRAYDDQEDVAGLLDEVEAKILKVREDGDQKASMGTMKEHVMEALDEIEKLVENPNGVTGLPTGFKDYDEMTNGLHGGEMVVIAARPSMGKTSFAMNIVEHVAIEAGRPCAVFSLEMSTASLVQRLLCSRAEIEMGKLRGGFISKKRDFRRLTRAAEELSVSNIFIDDTPGLSILEMRAKARRFKKMYGIEMIMIDYLQLLKSTSKKAGDNRQVEIAEISAGVKSIAKELNIPVIVLAQLNRNPESRTAKSSATAGRPRISDLRESGSIEQDADLVGLLTRSAYYAETDDEKEEEEGKAELIIAKQRNGPTGDIPLTFMNKYMRFLDRAKVEGDDF